MSAENAEIVRRSFSVQAENFRSDAMNFTNRDYLDDMVSRLDLAGTVAALEVAAGTCACACAVSPFVRTMTCLDVTDEMLEAGREYACQKGLDNMVFVRGDVCDLPFPDESFDLVLSRLAFHHFVDIDTPFREMRRVLRPGGQLVLIDMEAAGEEWRDIRDGIERMRDVSHVRNLSRQEILALFEKYGLPVTYCGSRHVPVSLESWLGLTKVPEETGKRIAALMQEDICGGDRTGFEPYRDGDGRICFSQKWLMTVGIKKEQEKVLPGGGRIAGGQEKPVFDRRRKPDPVVWVRARCSGARKWREAARRLSGGIGETGDWPAGLSGSGRCTVSFRSLKNGFWLKVRDMLLRKPCSREMARAVAGPWRLSAILFSHRIREANGNLAGFPDRTGTVIWLPEHGKAGWTGFFMSGGGMVSGDAEPAGDV